MIEDCKEVAVMSCNKDTVEKTRLQKWSRGIYFLLVVTLNTGNLFTSEWLFKRRIFSMSHNMRSKPMMSLSMNFSNMAAVKERCSFCSTMNI